MTAKGFVKQDFFTRWVEIGLIEDGINGRRVVIWPHETLATSILPEDTVPPENSVLKLPEHLARALYESLAEHYGGLNAEHVVKLRQDYDHERKRVDKLIDHAISQV